MIVFAMFSSVTGTAGMGASARRRGSLLFIAFLQSTSMVAWRIAAVVGHVPPSATIPAPRGWKQGRRDVAFGWVTGPPSGNSGGGPRYMRSRRICFAVASSSTSPFIGLTPFPPRDSALLPGRIMSPPGYLTEARRPQ